MAVFFFPYTDYTNYTDYTPYTRYTINPGKTARKRIPVWLIRKIYKRTRPMFQARPCIPAEYGGMRSAKGRVLHIEKRACHI